MRKLIVIFLLIPFSLLAQEEKPNIIWITCEDISPYISAFGDELVNTPNIDALAADGVKYSSTYTVAGVCAPSRAGIITGMHPMSIGAQHMRTRAASPKYQTEGIPNYDVVLPPEVKAFPEYLRKAGYYTSNNMKEDYQFEEPVTVWDESSSAASYKHRDEGQPFFSVFNFFITHESQIMKYPEEFSVQPDEVESKIPGFYEDSPTVRKDIANLLTHVEWMDNQVGDLIAQLKEEGLYENSYIFFFSDHGGNLPWTKREVLERGTHIPLVVKLPKSEKAGTEVNDLISSVDFAPSVLSVAGIKPPEYLQGKAFLGEHTTTDTRKYVYAARDRADAFYDRVRAVRDDNFRYIYNYHPEKPRYQDLGYRKGIPSMREILEKRDNGEIKNPQLQKWFESPKAVEELYNVTEDPDELHNLAEDPEYQDKLVELRRAFLNWTSRVGDLSYMSEPEMVYDYMWNGEEDAPQTKPIELLETNEGIRLMAPTEGTSIGYRIVKKGEKETETTHTVKTWDIERILIKRVENGDKLEAPKRWKVYDSEFIKLKKGDRLEINAMRIGYKPYTTTFTKE